MKENRACLSLGTLEVCAPRPPGPAITGSYSSTCFPLEHLFFLSCLTNLSTFCD